MVGAEGQREIRKDEVGHLGQMGQEGRMDARPQRVISLYLIIDITQYNIKYNNTKHNRRKLLCGKDLGPRGLPRPS